ncbi:MAG: hypothetical protein WD598_11565 [Acidimicrobiia bacterium]
MQPWWETWAGRREAELAAFSRHNLAFTVDAERERGGQFVLRGVLPVDDEAIDLVVAYPDTYPDIRFTVYAPNLTLDRHQNPFAKNLCVFPRASEHWRPTFLAADIIVDRVPDLVRVVRSGGQELRDLEEPQGEPRTDYYSYSPVGGVLIPDAVLRGAQGHDSGELTLRMARDTEWLVRDVEALRDVSLGQALVLALRRGQQELGRAEPELEQAFVGPTWTGRWVRVTDPPATPDWSDFAQQLFTYHPDLDPHNGKAPSHQPMQVIGLVFEEEVRQGVCEDAWMFVAVTTPRHSNKRKKNAPQPLRVKLLRGMRCGRDDLGVRVPELAPLQTKTVAVAGLGTLGSRIGRELARGLTRTVRVLDPDFVDAGTVVRWDRGLNAAGAAKALAVREDFRRDYPFTDIEVFLHCIGATGDGPRDGEILDAWAIDADLLIDATAEENVSAALAADARRMGMTFLVVWSIEGLGGVVARIIPGRTGCYHCLELLLSPDHDGIALPAPADPPRRIQPRGCADRTFTAPAADLSPLVDQATRLAYGELCGMDEGGYPRSSFDVHVLFLRAPDGSLIEPMRWEVHELQVHPDCQLCNAA